MGLAVAPLALPAERKGEAVREMTGGVPTREGGLLGLLIAGLSHEEKKSSSGSPAGVALPSAGVPGTSSVITTSSGYLYACQIEFERWYSLEHTPQCL